MEIVEGVLNIGPFRAVTWGIIVLFVGRWLVGRSAFLRDYNLPEPVVGGLLFALLFAWAGVRAFIGQPPVFPQWFKEASIRTSCTWMWAAPVLIRRYTRRGLALFTGDLVLEGSRRSSGVALMVICNH